MEPTANQRVPPQSFLQRPKHFWRHRLKPRLKFIFVPDIFLYDVWENVFLTKIQNLEPFKQFSNLIMCISESDWTTRLGLRLIQTCLDHHVLPRVTCIKHET